MPSCFISYAWESDAHRHWVRSLAKRLEDAGVETHLDQWDLAPGLDFLQFMEQSVRKSDYVLLICTPLFAQKANSGTGGVGYEKAVVSGEIYVNQKPGKFVPILRRGQPEQALPSYLLSKVFIDFRDDTKFEEPYEDLLRHMLGKPRHVRPPRGSAPELSPSNSDDYSGRPASGAQQNVVSRTAELTYCCRCGETPGHQSSCTGTYTHHDFSLGSGHDYCSRCGIEPGKPSVCVGTYTYHAFQAGSRPDQTGALDYCSRCGQVPRHQSTCSGTYTYHDFIPGSVRDYCTRCGVRPGKPSFCTGTYTHHDFRRPSAPK